MKSGKNVKVWIDLDNSPHVPFFKPIISELKKENVDLLITARDCFQVCGLAKLLDIDYKKIGHHYGKNKILKVYGTIIRALQLLPIAIKEKPILSISHGSRSQLIASFLLGIPHVLFFDYEHSKGLGIIQPRWNIAPEVIPKTINNSDAKKSLRYPGLKEDVYVNSFVPKYDLRKMLKIGKDEILVTIRPPATEAHYHNPEADILFAETVNYLSTFNNLRLLILPRNEIKQKKYILNNWKELFKTKKAIIPEVVIDGLEVIWESDFVISGGGTMNREAAAMGVPVYTIFRGKIGQVDRFLSQNGRLSLIEKVEDIKKKILIEKRTMSKGERKLGNPNTIRIIITFLKDIIAEV